MRPHSSVFKLNSSMARLIFWRNMLCYAMLCYKKYFTWGSQHFLLHSHRSPIILYALPPFLGPLVGSYKLQASNCRQTKHLDRSRTHICADTESWRYIIWMSNKICAKLVDVERFNWITGSWGNVIQSIKWLGFISWAACMCVQKFMSNHELSIEILSFGPKSSAINTATERHFIALIIINQSTNIRLPWRHVLIACLHLLPCSVHLSTSALFISIHDLMRHRAQWRFWWSSLGHLVSPSLHHVTPLRAAAPVCFSDGTFLIIVM